MINDFLCFALEVVNDWMTERMESVNEIQNLDLDFRTTEGLTLFYLSF